MGKTVEKSGTTVRKPRTAKNGPTHKQIAQRAYEIYLERGGSAGNELADWTQAERELAEKQQKTRRKTQMTTEVA